MNESMKLRISRKLTRLSATFLLCALCLLMLAGFGTEQVWAAAKQVPVSADASGSELPFSHERAIDDLAQSKLPPTLSRWYVGATGHSWLKLDLGSAKWVDRWTVQHMGDDWDQYYGTGACNTRDFKLQKSDNGTLWTDVDTVTANTASSTDRELMVPFKARYVRLYITQGNQLNNKWASVKDFSVYGKAYTVQYNVNGTVQSSVGADFGEKITAPVAPVLPDGSIFVGWYKDAASTLPWVFDTDRVNGDLDLYAKILPPVALVPGEPATATIGTAYSYQFAASGGQGPYTFAVESGDLPAGVTLSADGTLSGIPTVYGSFSFAVRASDSQTPAGAVIGYFVLRVDPSPVTVFPAMFPENLGEGDAFSHRLMALGGTGSYRFSLTGGTLPQGLSLSTAGDLTGTVEAAGTYTFTITATDSRRSDISGSRQFVLTVNASPMTGIEVHEGTLEYLVGDPLNETNLTVTAYYGNGTSKLLDRNEYTISGFDSSQAAQTQTVTVTVGALSDTFDVSIGQLRGLALKTAPRLSYTDNDFLDLRELSVIQHHRYTDENVDFADFAAHGLTVEQADGKQLALSDNGMEIRVSWNEATTSVSAGVLQVAPIPVSVNAGDLPVGIDGEAYPDYTFEASGGTHAFTFSVTSGHLPNGMDVDGSGALSGSPTEIGTFTFTVTASDNRINDLTGSRQFTLMVNPAAMTGIEVFPNTIEYRMGESLDESDLVVKATYRNGRINNLLWGEFTVEGFDSSHAALQQRVTVSAGGFTDTYDISIRQDIGLEILTQPRLNYTEGDALDLSALRVCLHDVYTDETVSFSSFSSKGLYTDPADGSILALSHGGSTINVVWSDRTTSAQTLSLTISEFQIPDPGSIGGTVTDAEGNPLAGAKVTVSTVDGDQSDTTNGDGEYTIGDIPPGTYTVFAGLKGYTRGSVTGVAVASGEKTKAVDLELTELLYATDILTFSVPGQAGDSIIDTNNHAVLFHMPHGTDVTALTPALTVSEKAEVSPGSGETQDFTHPVTYTVSTEWSANATPEEVTAAAVEDLSTDLAGDDQNDPMQEPEQSEDPEESEDPEQIEDPEQSEDPEQTEDPEQSEDPEQTEDPEQSEDPEPTEDPEPAQNPELTQEQDSDPESGTVVSMTRRSVGATYWKTASDLSGAMNQLWTVTCIVDPEAVHDYTVTAESASGGSITASPVRAREGEQITVIVKADSGKRLKAGTLKYYDTEYHAISGTTFTMPAMDIRVTAEFEAIPAISGGGGGGSSKAAVVPSPATPEITLPEEKLPLGAVKFYDPYVHGYPDNSFHPGEAVTRSQLAAMFARILKLDTNATGTFAYSDVAQHNWAYGSIQAASRIGLFGGYADGTFRPDQPITRGEMAIVLSKYWDYMKVTTDTKPAPFSDTAGHWAENGINKAYNAEAMSGFNDGTFRPDAVTVREQAVVLINRIISRPGLNRTTPTFSDVPAGSWSYENVEAATSPQSQPMQ